MLLSWAPGGVKEPVPWLWYRKPAVCWCIFRRASAGTVPHSERGCWIGYSTVLSDTGIVRAFSPRPSVNGGGCLESEIGPLATNWADNDAQSRTASYVAPD